MSKTPSASHRSTTISIVLRRLAARFEEGHYEEAGVPRVAREES